MGKHEKIVTEMGLYILKYHDFLYKHNVKYPRMNYVKIKEKVNLFDSYRDVIGFTEWETDVETFNVGVLLPYTEVVNMFAEKFSILPRRIKEYMKMLIFPGGPFSMIQYKNTDYIIKNNDVFITNWLENHSLTLHNKVYQIVDNDNLQNSNIDDII